MYEIFIFLSDGPYIGPQDKFTTPVAAGNDVVVTITQTQGQSTEVTNREYTISIATTGQVLDKQKLIFGFYKEYESICGKIWDSNYIKSMKVYVVRYGIRII